MVNSFVVYEDSAKWKNTCQTRRVYDVKHMNTSISFGEPLTTYPLPLLAEFFHEMSEFGKNELFHREADRVF
jgi:hypothetical protein